MILHSDCKGNDCIQKLRCHCIQILHSDIYSVYLSVNVDVESFWYKTEIIYFVWLCVIVWFTLNQNFCYLKLINGFILFESGGWFFYYMLTRKRLSRNSLKYTFVLDAWFGHDCICSNIEHLSNIDEMRQYSQFHHVFQSLLCLHF